MTRAMEPATGGATGRPWRRMALVVAFLLAITACGGPGSSRGRPPDGAQALAEQLASALQTGSIASLPLTDPERSVVDYQQVTGAMDDLFPEVAVGAISYDRSETTASVQLDQRYVFRTGEHGEWAFRTTATLRYPDAEGESASPGQTTPGQPGWQVVWAPTIVHPELDAGSRLYHERMTPKRGSIVDATGAAIVEERPVYRVGIDKTRVEPDQTEASARALAALVDIDADSYAQLVAAYGPQAFVLAIILREGQVPPAIDTIPGAAAFATTLPLAPTPTFAQGILGVSGEATAEVIEASHGEVQMGDIVGLSGLQKIHDAQLRGLPGHSVTIIKRSETQLAALPPAASPSPSASPAPTRGASPSAPVTPKPPNQLLFSLAPQDGEPLQLTMELELQRRAEDALAGYQTLVMVAVLDRATGAILAAANSPSAGAQSFVTTGGYPPGSTMKVATALALLRRGYTPDSPVTCSPTAEVNGRVFRNYPGYPASLTGQISLRTALEQSCNTAFMNAGRQFGASELHDAAASLGIGVDFETGFDAFYGSVPPSDDPVVQAAATIGQGNVAMSPMAMAAVAASAGSGHTVVPYLLADQRPTPTAAPLTEGEAAMLRDMMGAVVQGGTLMGLRGVLEGGKSGTAEYTNDNPPRTHTWTIGFAGRYAIAVMDYEHGGNLTQDVVRKMLA